MNLYVYYKIQKDQYSNKSILNQTTDSLCYVNTSTVAYKNQISAQKQASNWIMYFTVGHSAPGIVTNVVLGSYSDTVGRKFLFTVSLFGAILRALGCALGIYFEYNLIYILPGYLLEGLAGGFGSVLQAGYSYLSDTTSGKQRSFSITVMELTLGLAFTCGGFVAGYFINSTNYFYPMILSLSLPVISLFIVILFLPETVPKNEHNSSFSLWKYTKEVLSLYVKSDGQGNRWKYNVAILAFLFSVIGIMTRSGIETLYQLDSPFCWTSIQIGWFSTLRQGCQQIGGIILIAILPRLFQDVSIAVLGVISTVAGFLVEAFAVSAIYLYIVPVISLAGSLPLPMMRAYLSKMTPANKQGAVFGSIGAVETISNFGGTVLINSIYTATVGTMRGFTFLVLAGLNGVGVVLLMILICVSKM